MSLVREASSNRRTNAAQRMRNQAALAAIVLAGTLTLAYTPLHGPVCYFRLLTGLPCPGCGLTRSLESLWRGDIPLSLRYHPLGLPIFLLCVWTLLVALLRHNRRPDGSSFARLPRLPLPLVFALFFSVWLVRMVFIWSGSKLFLW